MEDPSNAEIGRRLDEVAVNLRDGFDRMNLRLDRYVLAEVHQIYTQNTERRLDELGDRLDHAEANRVTSGRYILTTAVAVLALIGSVILGIIALL